MKNDKEFLNCVYEKRNAALSRRKIYRKRLLSGGAAFAACMVLMVGGWQMDLFGVSSDSATMEAAPPEDVNAVTEMTPGSDQVSDGAENGGSSQLFGQKNGYRMLPAASLTDAAGNSEACSGGEAVDEMENRAKALAEAGKAVKTDVPLENWQSDYAFQLQVEREAQVFTYYYISEEGDWNEEE